MRKMMILATVLMATACVHVGKSVLTRDFMGTPVPRGDVYVFFTTDSIPEHVRVALLDAQGDTDLTDEGDVINALREEAGKLGANAIILEGTEDAGTGAKVANALIGVTANRKGFAVAIFVPSLVRGHTEH